MNAKQNMMRIVADLQAHGYSYKEVTTMFTEIVNAQYGMMLHPDEIEALRKPVGRTAAELVERVEARCIQERFNMNSHPGNKTVLSIDKLAPKTYRNPNTIYLDDSDKQTFIAEINNTAVFTNATRHNYGADLTYMCNYDPVERTIDAAIIQQKIGSTPIGNAMADGSQSRSAYHISKKLYEVKDHLSARMEEEHGVIVRCRLEVHTTSPVRPVACKEFKRQGILVVNKDMMWDIWTPDVQKTLINLHGPATAKGLGV